MAGNMGKEGDDLGIEQAVVFGPQNAARDADILVDRRRRSFILVHSAEFADEVTMEEQFVIAGNFDVKAKILSQHVHRFVHRLFLPASSEFRTQNHSCYRSCHSFLSNVIGSDMIKQ